MNKSAQAGIIHLGLVIVFIVAGALGYFVYQNPQIINQSASAASIKASFSGLSAVLKQDSATLNFSYSGTSPNYKIDIATSSDMKKNLYRNFGQGTTNPIIVSNPQSTYAPYQCGSTLYWIVKATDQRSTAEIKSSVQSAKVDCGTGGISPQPSSTPIPTLTPTPSPTALPSSTPVCSPQTKPGTVSLQGADGTWCNDSDGNGNYSNVGSCQDSCSSTNDYCQADGTNRDGYCTGTWNGSAWDSVHCDFGGYVCSSFGKTCSGGACI